MPDSSSNISASGSTVHVPSVQAGIGVAWRGCIGQPLTAASAAVTSAGGACKSCLDRGKDLDGTLYMSFLFCSGETCQFVEACWP